MRHLTSIAAFLFCCAVATAAGAAVDTQSWQLMSGQDYLEMPEYDREVYVSGLNDAYNWSYAGGFERMKWLVPCARNRQAAQLAAVFGKWLRDNPERWHEPAAKLYPFAVFQACKKPKETGQ
jgi:hypothetical protein